MQAIPCGTAYFDGTTQLYSKANYALTHQSSHSINFQNAIYFFSSSEIQTAPLCIQRPSKIHGKNKNKEIYQWQVFLVHRLCHVPAHASRIRVYRSVVGAEVLCLRLAEFTSSDFRTYFPLFISLSLFSPLFSSLTYLLICRRCSTCFWLHCSPPLPSPALYGWRLTRPLSPSLWVSTLRLGPWRKRKQILSLARWYELISHLPVYCFQWLSELWMWSR